MGLASRFYEVSLNLQIIELWPHELIRKDELYWRRKERPALGWIHEVETV